MNREQNIYHKKIANRILSIFTTKKRFKIFEYSSLTISKYFNQRAYLYISFCLLMIPFLNSCGDTFEPFEENDKFFFTMYGFLDASADTQWVRISPVRGTFDAPAEIPDMEVILDNLDENSSIIMNKKLVQFGNQFNAINVWTDKAVRSENTYRISALNPNGTQSEAVVTIPGPFPVPQLRTESTPGIPTRYFLYVNDVEHLADVQSRWHYRVSIPAWEEERFHVFSLKDRAKIVDMIPGNYMVELTPDEEKELIIKNSLALTIPGAQIEFLENQLFVASAGPEWDDNISNIDDLIYNLPDGFSNVENGLGYMVGIYSRNIPFKTCLNEIRELTSCPEVDPFF